MPDKPVNESTGNPTAAAKAAFIREMFAGQENAVFSAALGYPMDAIKRAVEESPSFTPPELYSLPERYGDRHPADIPSDPDQAAAQLARLLTRADPGQLATALRRIADALDALTPTNEDEEEANDDEQ